MARKPARPAGRDRVSRTLLVNAIGILVALPAIGYSFYLATPVSLAQNGERLLADAGVSMSADVPANPYNTLAAQLDTEQAALDQRAATLNAQESAINQQNSSASDWGLASIGISVFLLILVSLNFYLDMRRRRPQTDPLAKKFLVDLR
jgi:predicted PurR-regulated permease PerM